MVSLGPFRFYGTTLGVIVKGHWRSPWYMETWIDVWRVRRMKQINRIRAREVAALKAKGLWLEP